ncbi:MAG: hypothetical protein DRP99_01190 [Candidatus Latescibacterota bacterium]|nr:MAG: hypothetical protein DRP99_01190 [Candidatus Latescibacterota bacterium]
MSLADFVQESGTLKAVVARTDGEVLDAVGIRPGDREVLPKAASIALRLGKVLEQYEGVGSFSTVWIQFEEGSFLIQWLTDRVFLIALAGPKGSVGMVPHHMNRALPDLAREYGEGQDEVAPLEGKEASGG